MIWLLEWSPLLIGGLMADYFVVTGPTESLAVLIPIISTLIVMKAVVSMWGVSLYVNRQNLKPLLVRIKNSILR